ncbi:hypothetical protein FACS1894185_6340 [Betaproteobacteria bacterium]|nr:hypothetical protein FACS1894185_6340 [Betaproteobacteria bacterium]
MKTRPACALLSLVLCLGFSADALADGHSGHSRHAPQQRQQAHRAPPQSFYAQRPPVVITHYVPQRRVVVAAPLVVYRAPMVVYQEPVYYYAQPAVVYETASPVIIQQAPQQPLPPAAPPAENSPNGLSAAKVIGAVAGGVIGSRFGGGNGRLVTTAAGAVLGSVIADELSR